MSAPPRLSSPPTRQRLALVALAGIVLAGATTAVARSPLPPSQNPPSSAASERSLDTAKAARDDVEYREVHRRASSMEKVAASLGFGSLAGLGLPVLVLAGAAMRTLDVEPPVWIARYVDPSSTLYSWPFVLVALLALALFLLSGNEKLSKGPKLIAQLAGIPPAAFLALAMPIVAELDRAREPVALLVQAGGAVAVPESAAGLTFLTVLGAVGLGLIALACASLLLVTRLLVSVACWLSPFPFVDATFNLLFHGYAVGMVLLTLFAPPVALVVMVVQAVVAIILVRRLVRFARVSVRMVSGLIAWHLLRQRDDAQPPGPEWADRPFGVHGCAAQPRLSGWVQAMPDMPRHGLVAFGVNERGALLLRRRGFRVEEQPLPALEIDSVRFEEGLLFDSLSVDHRQGTGPQRVVTTLVIATDKRFRPALHKVCDELRERGLEVVEGRRVLLPEPGLQEASA